MRDFFTVLFVGVLVPTFVGCSEPQETLGLPTLRLSSSEGGVPRIDYVGDGALSYTHGLRRFNFTIVSPSGETWASGKGEFVWGKANDLRIEIDVDASRPFQIELLGFSSLGQVEKEDPLEEVVPVKAGTQSLQFQRFCHRWHEF